MKTPPPAVAFALVCGVLAAPAAAQATWLRTPTTLAPQGRYSHAAAYDLIRGRLVMFSGLTSPFNDTWELAGATWVRRVPALSPSARLGHWMAYDVGRARVVLFGGSTDGFGSGCRGDTWEWDGVNWTQQLPAQSPTARHLHAMTMDWVNGRIVLFGGREITGTYLNDTWAWNGTNWMQIASTGPSPRCAFDLVQDIPRGRIVLFGGANQGALGETWEFDGLAWHLMQPAISPTARSDHRMSYDPVLDQLILHGGRTGSSETWQWDGVTWTLLDTSIQRFAHVLQYDWWVGRPTVFGGADGLGPAFGTTWTFGVAAPATVVPFGSGCAGPMGTPQLFRLSPSLPWIGYTITLGTAPVSAFVLVLFGWSNTVSGSITLPYSLAPHGAPGCSVLVSPDAVFGVVGAGSGATMAVAVPFAPSLVGMQFFNQVVSFDPGANALGLTTSNGTASTIGWR